MNIRSAEALARFCAEQCLAFDPRAWAARSHDPAVMAVARYLAQTSWYGHEEELERIAGQAADGCRASSNQQDAVDWVNFSVAVRCRIAALQGRHPRHPEPASGIRARDLSGRPVCPP
ncbi:MAG: hypothetical protein ACHQIO_20645, partial [Nevskiales bacterium]